MQITRPSKSESAVSVVKVGTVKAGDGRSRALHTKLVVFKMQSQDQQHLETCGKCISLDHLTLDVLNQKLCK